MTEPSRETVGFVVIALGLVGLACGKPAPADAPPTEQPARAAPLPTKGDCTYCAMSAYRGEPRCMDVQDGPCGDSRVGSCTHANAFCAHACCADAGR